MRAVAAALACCAALAPLSSAVDGEAQMPSCRRPAPAPAPSGGQCEAAALRAFIESTSKVGAMRTLRALDYFGTGVFAVAGTVVAADHG